MRLLLTWILFSATVTSVWAQGQVRDLPPGWKPEGLHRVPAAGAKASSVFGDPEGTYAVARAVDGNRSTKWVASVAASEASPQWIVVELFGPRRVSAVALFGVTPGRDGVRDAQVQVATTAAADSLSTVAAVKDARTGQWLATFDPVTTSAVRLLVTRSGGVSTHTDVHEVEIYGPPLQAAEQKALAAESLNTCRRKFTELLDTKKKHAAVPRHPELWHMVMEFGHRLMQAQERLARWDSLTVAERQALAEQAERLEIRAQQVARWVEADGAPAPDWRKRIEEARQAAVKLAPGDKTTSVRDGNTLRLLNRHVMVSVEEASARWDATWLGSAAAAVRRASFSVDLDGKRPPADRASVTVEPFTDRLGSGMQIRQQWAGPIVVERRLRVYDGKPAVAVSGSVTNRSDRDVRLGAARLIDVTWDQAAWWSMGRTYQTSAVVGYPGAAPPCRPADELGPGAGGQSFGSAGVLALAHRQPDCGLAIGLVTAVEGSPSVGASFRPGQGGTGLTAVSNVGGRVLGPGKTVTLDTAWLSVEADPLAVLEHYGDAVAAMAQGPLRTKANALWCSWYPFRMSINEENVLANAAVAAEHFKPLGLDLMQLDHGWQRGDVCGDWTPNERFPHGLKWLAEQLQSRYGLRLGLWIAPTQVAFTSRLFAEHPEWMRRNAEGKPASSGRWFWKPNPEMGVLDASQPGAEKWIADTFRRLTAEGSCYYKIDFIAGSPALARAMTAIREGTGPEPWIRYCQTPPLLSAGLANSAYIGIDTGDAGMKGTMEVLRENAALLAASFWVNDRLYHREVCDMSVGMQASVEEARLRLALMTLSGCSISFSDDLRQLKLPRIRMMQQCLPPGNPLARPLDLFERRLPSLWHMHCKNAADEWDVVGLFNFEDQAEERTLDLSALKFAPAAPAAVCEFWEGKFLGVQRRSVIVNLPPHSSRVLIVRRLTGRPQVIATDMHLLGGYHELTQLTWDAARRQLSGQYRRAPGLSGNSFLYVPAGFRPRANGASQPTTLKHLGDNLWSHQVQFKTATADWSIDFDSTPP